MWSIDSLETLAQAKRRIYLLAWPFGMAALLIAWIAKGTGGSASSVELVLFPLIGVYLAFIFVALFGWRSDRAIALVERSLFAVVASSLLARYGDILFAGAPGTHDAALADLLYWIPMVYVLAHLVFRGNGTRVCILYLAALTALGVSYALRSPPADHGGNAYVLSRFYMGNAAYIVLLSACTKIEQLYARAVAHAQGMARLANTDALVGLPNRRHLQGALERELERARRFNRALSIVFFDLDQFKRINDSFGHERGDQVLREIGALVKSQLRPSDELGRWGGDEFLLIVPELSASAAAQMAERVRGIVAEHLGGTHGAVTASFGVAAFPQFASADALLKAADQALARAKESGKNRVEMEF